MDYRYILSMTGSGARAVRDVITHRLWSGFGQEDNVGYDPHLAATALDYSTVHSKTGW